MNNRRKLTALVGVGNASPRPQLFGEDLLARIGGVMTTARRTLIAVELAVIAALALAFFRPELLDDLKALSPFADTTGQEVADEDTLVQSLALPERSTVTAHGDRAAQAQQRVTDWLAKRYRIAGSASNMLVGAAYESAQAVKIDPLLILAVMAIESRFNPYAESSVGAQGLMQVMSKVHHEKFSDHGGLNAALNPVANIQVGAQILKDTIRRAGSTEAGLKLYVGAGNLATDGGYADKVMAEHARLRAVAAGKRVPTFTQPQSAERVREAKAPELQNREPAKTEPA